MLMQKYINAQSDSEMVTSEENIQLKVLIAHGGSKLKTLFSFLWFDFSKHNANKHMVFSRS